eukprot:8645333-Alexandrium_andersonii.AAC.1
MRSDSQETVLVGNVATGPMQQQPRQASPGQQREQQQQAPLQEPMGNMPLGTMRGNTQLVAPSVNVDPVPRGIDMPQETMGNQVRAQRNREATQYPNMAEPKAGTPLGTAESASSAVYVPTEPQVPEWQARYPARAFRARNSRVVTLEGRKELPH